MSEPELTIPASPRVNGRLIVALCVGAILLSLVLVERDSIWLYSILIAGLGAWWFGFVRTTALFVNEDRAGIRYAGGLRRSAKRSKIVHVWRGDGTVILYGARRWPLRTLHLENWTDDQRQSFVRRVGMPVFSHAQSKRFRALRKTFRHDTIGRSGQVLDGWCVQWNDEEGWGVVAGDDGPGAVWVSTSAVNDPGDHALRDLERVTFEWEAARGRQDDYAYIATSATPVSRA